MPVWFVVDLVPEPNRSLLVAEAAGGACRRFEGFQPHAVDVDPWRVLAGTGVDIGEDCLGMLQRCGVIAEFVGDLRVLQPDQRDGATCVRWTPAKEPRL